jgi:hypothetical protein
MRIRIRNPARHCYKQIFFSKKNFLPIPDSGSRGLKGTGFRIRIRNTAYEFSFSYLAFITVSQDTQSDRIFLCPSDIILLFSDSYNYLSVQYNMEDAEEYQCAIRLEKFFEKEVKKLGLSEEPAAAPKAKRNRRTM